MTYLTGRTTAWSGTLAPYGVLGTTGMILVRPPAVRTALMPLLLLLEADRGPVGTVDRVWSADSGLRASGTIHASALALYGPVVPVRIALDDTDHITQDGVTVYVGWRLAGVTVCPATNPQWPGAHLMPADWDAHEEQA